MKLEDHWNDEKTAWESLRTKAQAQLADLQDQLGDAQTARAAAITRLEKAQAALTTARAALAAEANLGDIPDLTVTARKQLALVQEAQGDLARVTETILDLQAQIEQFDAAARAADDEVDVAETALATAKEKGDQRDEWIAAAAAAPLDTLAGSGGDAHAALSTDPLNAAHAKIVATVGATLTTLLGKRHAVALEYRSEASKGLDAVIAAWTGEYATSDAAEAVLALTAAYQRAYDALGDYVTNGQQRYQAAVTALQTVATGPLATDAEIADLGSGAFTTEPARGNALTLAATRDDALSAYLAAYAKFERDAVAALAPDPDGTLAVSAPSSASLTTADASYGQDATAGDDSTSPRALVEQWQTALPDEAYRMMASFFTASDALADLAATPGKGDTDTLVSLLQKCEDSLAKALSAAAKSRRKTAFLQLALTLQKRRVSHAELVQGDLLFGLLRGDL
jgi:hypothetical protein